MATANTGEDQDTRKRPRRAGGATGPRLIAMADTTCSPDINRRDRWIATRIDSPREGRYAGHVRDALIPWLSSFFHTGGSST